MDLGRQIGGPIAFCASLEAEKKMPVWVFIKR
jgi:hypothetical protein